MTLAFPEGAVVQLVVGHPADDDALVVEVQSATVAITADAVVADSAVGLWSWPLADLVEVHHAVDDTWTVLVVPGVDDHGVAVAPGDVHRFRAELHRRADTLVRSSPPPMTAASPWAPTTTPRHDIPEVPERQPSIVEPNPSRSTLPAIEPALSARAPGHEVSPTAATLEARDLSAWFGAHQVLDRVSLEMPAGEVTALIGPSGCGKSTFLRILNRMHELVPSASLAGEVLLEGSDVYDPGRKLNDARRQIGMVFQKPNPFPAMSIYDNVVAGFRLTGTKLRPEDKEGIVESCLRQAGLWNEVKDRLGQPGGSLSGGQQQRLCIARAMAVGPRVLLMDEPCSALDPTSTRRIEQTIAELAGEVTIVIVTHNMQQARRVSAQCAFFLAEQGTPGVIVEHGPTTLMFDAPQDERTNDYVNGRFG